MNDLKWFEDKNFELRQKVEIHSTGSSELDGKTGFILGRSTNDISTHYIVMLDEPMETHLAINITQFCLNKI